MDFKLLLFQINIVKMLEILYKGNLLKAFLMPTYPTNFFIFFSHFHYGKKMQIFDVFKTCG